MSINREDVEHVALHARLELSEEEIQNFTDHLNSMLDWIKKLDNLEIGNVEPTVHVLLKSNVFREDKVTQSLDIDKILENAPDSKDGFFRVPKIV